MKRSSKLKAQSPKAIGLFCVFAVLTLSSVVFAVEPEDAAFTLAKRAFNDGLYDLAQEKLEGFLAAYPHTPYLYDAHMLLGRCLYNLNNPSKALYEFDIVLEAPGGTKLEDEALYWTGEICSNEGNYSKALEYYQKLIEKFPSSRYMSYAVYSKGWAYFELGFLDDAVDMFRDVVEKYPFDKVAVDAQFRVGEAAYLSGNYRNALDEFGSFMEKFPVSDKTADAYYMNGEALFRSGRYKEAAGSLARAVSIAPKARWADLARYRMARAYCLAGDYAAGTRQFRECADSQARGIAAQASLIGLADAYIGSGRPEEAAKACDELIEKYPDGKLCGRAAYIKSKILFGQGKYGDAEAALEDALAAYGSSEAVWDMRYELGCVYMLASRLDEAAGQFAMVRNGARDPELVSGALSKAGDICMLKKDLKAAAENFDSILTKYPDSKQADYAQYQLGNILLYTGKAGQAALAFKSLLKNFPASPLREKARARLAAAAFLSNDFVRAAAEYERLTGAGAAAGPASSWAGKFYLADSFYNMSRYAEALPLLKEVSRNSTDENMKAMADYLAGWCYYNMKREQDAVDSFAGFIKTHPGSPLAADAGYWFGEYHRSKGRFGKAREYFASVARNHPSSEIAQEALFQAAVTYQEEGNSGEAVRRLEGLAMSFPDTAIASTAYRKAARIEKEREAFDRAVDDYRKAIRAGDDETNAQVQYEIAEAFESKADLAMAAEEYMKAHRLYPKGAFWATRGLLKAAQTFERMGKLPEAKKAYEELAAMDVEESKMAKEKLKTIMSVR